MSKSYTRKQIDDLLLRDLVSQQLLHFLLGRREVELYERHGLLTPVLTGHRVRKYSTAQYFDLKRRLSKGEVILSFAALSEEAKP
jgi:hypothetical protein